MSGVNRQFTILQYNVAKSKNIAMASLLRDPAVWEYDVITLQEPWHNPHVATTHHPVKDRFHLFYPQGSPARTCFFIHKRLNSTCWTAKEWSPDLCAFRIVYNDNAVFRRLYIHNVYNQHNRTTDPSATLNLLGEALRHSLEVGDHHLALGDFNLHHP